MTSIGALLDYYESRKKDNEHIDFDFALNDLKNFKTYMVELDKDENLVWSDDKGTVKVSFGKNVASIVKILLKRVENEMRMFEERMEAEKERKEAAKLRKEYYDILMDIVPGDIADFVGKQLEHKRPKAILDSLSNMEKLKMLFGNKCDDAYLAEVLKKFKDVAAGKHLNVSDEADYHYSIQQLQSLLKFCTAKSLDNGKIIQMPRIFDHLPNSAILFWRKSYKEIFERYIARTVRKISDWMKLSDKDRAERPCFEKESIVICGDPGVGKSSFCLLLFCILAASGVSVIRVSESGSWMRAVGGEIDPTLHTSELPPHRSPSTILLIDGKVESHFFGKVTNAIVFCSSKKDNYRPFVKNFDCKIIYLEPWGFDEVEEFVKGIDMSTLKNEAVEKLFFPILRNQGIADWPEREWQRTVLKVLEDRYVIVGGRIRLLLQHMYSTRRLRKLLFQSMGKLTLADLNRISTVDITSYAPSICYSIVPLGNDRSSFEVGFCSPTAQLYSAFHLAWKCADTLKTEYNMLMESSIGSKIKGDLFEAIAHLIILMTPNLCFTIRRLNHFSSETKSSGLSTTDPYHYKLAMARNDLKSLNAVLNPNIYSSARRLTRNADLMIRFSNLLKEVAEEIQKLPENDSEDSVDRNVGLLSLLSGNYDRDINSICLMSGMGPVNKYEPTFFRSDDADFKSVISKCLNYTSSDKLYYIPKVSNFHAVDAFCNGIFLQMTVSLEHPIKQDYFEKELEKMGWSQLQPVVLIFVVPEYNYLRFQVQSGWEKSSFKIIQYVMELKNDSLSSAFKNFDNAYSIDKNVGSLFAPIVGDDNNNENNNESIVQESNLPVKKSDSNESLETVVNYRTENLTLQEQGLKSNEEAPADAFGAFGDDTVNESSLPRKRNADEDGNLHCGKDAKRLNFASK